MRNVINYQLGDVVRIPLSGHDAGVAKIVRMNHKGGIYCYFFSLGIKDVKNLSVKDAILILNTSDLGIIQGKWQIVYKDDGFRPNDWPMKPMGRIDEVSSTGFITVYDDELRAETEQKVPIEVAMNYPHDSIPGYEAAEEVYKKVLKGGSSWPDSIVKKFPNATSNI